MSWLKKLMSNNQKQLIIARGPSGSGKSRMAKELSAQHGNAPIFSSDEFFMKNGIYEFDVRSLGDAHKWNQTRVEDSMSKGVPVVIVDNTNTTGREMRPYVDMAIRHGYDVHFEEPNWNPKLKTHEGKWNVDFLDEMQRNSDRAKQKKSLGRDIIQRMVDRYEYNPTVEKVLQNEAIH